MLKENEIKVGDTHTAVLVEDLKRTQIVQYAGASGDYNPLHSDEIFTTKVVGYPSVFAHGMLSTGYLARMITNWVPQSTIRSWKNRFTAMTHIGDIVTCTGKITEKFEEGGEKLVRLELQTNTSQGQTIIAEAVVALE